MVDRAETTSTTLSSPHIESMLAMFGPKPSGILGGNIQTDAFAPSVAAQNQAQQQAMKTALGQQGFTYDPVSGAVGGSGIAAFQPYLDKATTAADAIQGAGATALTKCSSSNESNARLSRSSSDIGGCNLRINNKQWLTLRAQENYRVLERDRAWFY